MPLPNDSLFFGLRKSMTGEQLHFVNSIFDKQLTIVNARSGTGKTTLAVGAAKIIGKPLIYIFSPVEEAKMGFRPGTQEEKEQSYLQPLADALSTIGEHPSKVIYSEENFMNLKNGNVWVYPKSHIFARGTNMKGCTVIIDEAQNFTVDELKKVLTRIHDDCKVIMIGHDKQCDLKNPRLSGFVPYLEHFRNEHYVSVCELTKNFRGKLAQKADDLEVL